MINFNDIIMQEYSKEYGGSEDKIGVIINYKRYILKLADKNKRVKNIGSYTNSSICEYIGSSIYKMLGIPVQNVILGKYTDKRGKIKIACACEDFTPQFGNLNSLKYLIQKEDDFYFDKSNSFYSNVEFLKYFFKDTLKNEKLYKESLERYYDMFVVDALIGNTDRHNGNWGFIVDDIGCSYSLAPVYDCGSGLSPNIEEVDFNLRKAVNDGDNCHSILKQKGVRISYKDFFNLSDDENLYKSIAKIFPKIDLNRINLFIDNIDLISQHQKEYYKKRIETSYKRILEPCYKKALEHSNEEEMGG